MFSEGSAEGRGAKEEVAFSKALVYQGHPGEIKQSLTVPGGCPGGVKQKDFWYLKVAQKTMSVLVI